MMGLLLVGNFARTIRKIKYKVPDVSYEIEISDSVPKMFCRITVFFK
jgi:hypothetical protein